MAAYKRYSGGRVIEVEDGAPEPTTESRETEPLPIAPAAAPNSAHGPLDFLTGRLAALEPNDLLLCLILYLLYKESGDTQLLITLGAYLLL
jgi:hypothetical protein